LLIGPWTHERRLNPIGEQNFGLEATAAFDFNGLQLRWFDHWLKGIDTGLECEAPIKLFVMGANIWRDEYEWPLARAIETRYYLHSNGYANTLHGDGVLSVTAPEVESPDHYSYDPANPVITHGGASLITPEYPGGPFDQRVTESRIDVLVYSTAPLEQDVEVTGPIRVRLWATSSARDTDFVARLVDVHTDGYARNLTDGIIRARYRHLTHGQLPSLLEPGQVYMYDIDLWATSNLFKKGHRIRLEITSSNFPRWDRNPNTGHDFGVDDELIVAQQTILHDAEHPSHIILPLVPA
jgi:putative CocE/NonD family hydrolase